MKLLIKASDDIQFNIAVSQRGDHGVWTQTVLEVGKTMCWSTS